MAAQGQEANSGFELNDILFVLLKHKWKIIALALIGLAGAVAVYLFDPPLYQSEAKLLVKYVLERNGIDAVERTSDAGRGGDTSVIGSELEILTSWDLALETAEAVGVERLLAGTPGTPNATAAAMQILSGLKVGGVKGTDVIAVSFRHSDPELARTVLENIVRRYKERHINLHRSGEAYDFVTVQRDAAKNALISADSTLKDEKKKAEIVSLPESVAALSTALARSQLELYDAETERAEQNARLEALEKATGSGLGTSNTATEPEPVRDERPQVPAADVEEYQLLAARLAKLRQVELDLSSRYLPEASTVKANQQQITSVQSQLRAMEKRHPDLAVTVPVTGAARGGLLDIVSERAKLAAIDAKVKMLSERLDQIRARAAEFVEIEPKIAELLRNKEVNETNYKLLAERLEKSRVDETLDPERIPNIGYVQKPSPALRAAGDHKKAVVALAGGGIGSGIALAFLLELVLNRTVKRPIELETRLGVPLLLSIPFIPIKGHPSRPLLPSHGPSTELVGKNQPRSGGITSPWEMDHFIRPFAEAVRDRLVLYFELSRLTRKPKLVAVTGLSEGAGVSTLAGGLAAALSETGDGKVLLVDMNVERTAVQPFFHGQAACSLIDALQPAHEMAATADNLYLATVADSNAGPMQLVPKRFYDLIPHLKASDFDYIIFDMPPVSESSATLAIAGFMDKVLFVVEAEENNTETLKRSLNELTAARANVSGIFNKRRSYAPKWMKSEL